MALVDEWVEKAEVDYKGAVGINRRRGEPLPDLVCYHCQQCAEKYLKAYLIMQGDVPPRTHNLRELLDLCENHDATLSGLLSYVRVLNPYSVQFRYPGDTATIEEAKEALRILRLFRRRVRRKLGL